MVGEGGEATAPSPPPPFHRPRPSLIGVSWPYKDDQSTPCSGQCVCDSYINSDMCGAAAVAVNIILEYNNACKLTTSTVQGEDNCAARSDQPKEPIHPCPVSWATVKPLCIP